MVLLFSTVALSASPLSEANDALHVWSGPAVALSLHHSAVDDFRHKVSARMDSSLEREEMQALLDLVDDLQMLLVIEPETCRWTIAAESRSSGELMVDSVSQSLLSIAGQTVGAYFELASLHCTGLRDPWTATAIEGDSRAGEVVYAWVEGRQRVEYVIEGDALVSMRVRKGKRREYSYAVEYTDGPAGRLASRFVVDADPKLGRFQRDVVVDVRYQHGGHVWVPEHLHLASDGIEQTLEFTLVEPGMASRALAYHAEP